MPAAEMSAIPQDPQSRTLSSQRRSTPQGPQKHGEKSSVVRQGLYLPMLFLTCMVFFSTSFWIWGTMMKGQVVELADLRFKERMVELKQEIRQELAGSKCNCQDKAANSAQKSSNSTTILFIVPLSGFLLACLYCICNRRLQNDCVIINNKLHINLAGKELSGKGSHGHVFNANYFGLRAVIKVYPLPEDGKPGSVEKIRQCVSSEVECWKKLPRHKNIVVHLLGSSNGEERAYEFGPDYLPYAYLIQERMHQTLDKFVHKSEYPAGYKYRFLVGLYMDIVEGLKHMHDHGLAHYDLKSNNIGLGEDEHAKLLDFGKSKERTREMYTYAVLKGALALVPPEVLKSILDNKPSGKIRPWQYDTFCVGVVMWEVLTGNYPGLCHIHSEDIKNRPLSVPNGEDTTVFINTEAEVNEKCKEKYSFRAERFPMSEEYPQELRNLINWCVHSDRNKRPEDDILLSTLKEMMEYGWIDDDIYNPENKLYMHNS